MNDYGESATRAAAGSLLLLCVLYFFGDSNDACADGPRVDDAPAEWLTAMRQDAELTDIFFVDAQHGWAVGDHGVIWHTVDGGQNWQSQRSGGIWRLEGVQFLDPKTGWAAGGAIDPYTHVSRGVVLRTYDSGRTWTPWDRSPIPALRQIKFVDRKHGWAIGHNSALFAEGLFATEDGGRAWTPLPPTGRKTWLSGDFLDRRAGIVAGRLGALGFIRGTQIKPSRTSVFPLGSIRAVKLAGTTEAIAVGDGGTVLHTRDGGGSWQNVMKQLPTPHAADFDFQALAFHDGDVWIAGSPGTLVFRWSHDEKRWTALETGQPLPLRALHFVDKRRGWAAGALGTILATTDGGRTWQQQRAGGRRAAWMGVFSDADRVPLEMVAQLSAGDGYLAAIEIVGRRDFDAWPPDDKSFESRFRQAMVAAGASATNFEWQFPLRQRGLQLPARRIKKSWQAASADGKSPSLAYRLAQRIRTWRPDVVVTQPAAAGDPAGRVVNQAVVRAVDVAANEADDGLQSLGLRPWKVKKVFVHQPTATAGAHSVAAARLVPNLGASLGDFVAPARGLLVRKYLAPTPIQSFALFSDHSPRNPGQSRGFFDGVMLRPGEGARRIGVAPAAIELEAVRRAAHRRQVIRAIVASAARDQKSAAGWLAQMNTLIGGLNETSAGEVLFLLGARYHDNGYWRLAAETNALLAEKFPKHPLAPAAMEWLVQYYASAEAAHRVGQQVPLPVRLAKAETTDPPQAQVAKFDLPASPASQKPLERSGRAAAWAEQIQAQHFLLFAEPRVRFPLAVAHRVAGEAAEAERIYKAMYAAQLDDSWAACAAGELRLIKKPATPTSEDEPALPMWTCKDTKEKPKLDGVLDETFWQTAASAAGTNGPASAATLLSHAAEDNIRPSTALLAHDGEFLYIGVKCYKAPDYKYAESAKPRPRDADLSAHDRIDLLIDVDRDRVTFYRFSLDHRGWTADACWGDGTWNPTWYVAVETGPETWTCEAAIPLDQLTDKTPARGDHWAIGIQRTVPGAGFQSWTRPAGVRVLPQGFGYVAFESTSTEAD